MKWIGADSFAHGLTIMSLGGIEIEDGVMLGPWHLTVELIWQTNISITLNALGIGRIRQ